MAMNDSADLPCPSRTAFACAVARAAHLLVDAPPAVFSDTVARTLLGEDAETALGFHRTHGEHPVLAAARAAVVSRARYAEDRLAEAVDRGITQYVVLGAGLDTFAVRSPLAEHVRVFEVDLPAMQDWKRRRLALTKIGVPPGTRFVPADLTAESPVPALCEAGFDLERPAFVSWLGGTMYVTRPVIDQTLKAIAGLAPGTELVVDHLLPESLRGPRARAYTEAVGAVAAEGGEPWLTFAGPADLAAVLEEHGMAVGEQLGEHEVGGAELWQRQDALVSSELSVLTHARVPMHGVPRS